MKILALIPGYILLLGGLWLIFHMYWTNWHRDEDDPLVRHYYELAFASVLAIIIGAAIIILVEGKLPFGLCFVGSCVGDAGTLR